MVLASLLAAVLMQVPHPDPAAPPSLRIAVAPGEVLAVTLRRPEPGAEIGRVMLIPPVMGSAFSLRRVTDELVALGYAVAIIDPLGMGGSSAPAGADFTLAAQAGRLLAVLDSVQWDRAIVAGHATSASIAFHVAARAPDRVQAVVAIAGGAVRSQETDGVQLAVRFAPIVDTRPGRAFARRTVERQLRERSANDAWLTPAVLEAYLAPWGDQVTARLRAIGAMGRTVEPMPIEVVLARVRCPVLVLLGEGPSKGLPKEDEIARIRTGIPAAEFVSVPGAGAMLPEEAPAAVAAGIHNVARR